MPKKLTHQFVKEQFESEGYELLIDKYINCDQKLEYICPNGHRHSISWDNWKSGNRCSYCSGKKKKTIVFIRSEFEKEDYILLTGEYKNSRQKLEYICPNGHKHYITWSMWNQGQRCLYCFGKIKKTVEFIRSEFEKEKYKLLTIEYKNAFQKLNYICPNGHRHSISWNNWRRGHKCPYCAGQGKPDIEFIRSEFEKERYVLLSDKYIGAHQKLNYICSRGHKHDISWHSWQEGQRCPYCAGVAKPTIEFIRSEFIKEGYKLLVTEYKNNDQKLDYICPKGHKHNIAWHNWQQGRRCPYCSIVVSKGEIEVRNFIESLGIKVSANDRNQIFNPDTGNGFELDIFMPTINKAIEYNGEYWHQDKSRDLLKQQLCKSKEIDLMTIWDKEWFNDSRKCKEKIMKFMF
jgi:DNA-directed RNA polymerase subunit RPC12/RpoP